MYHLNCLISVLDRFKTDYSHLFIPLKGRTGKSRDAAEAVEMETLPTAINN